MGNLLGGIEQSVSSFATTVTKDAGAFVAGAQNSVALLAGSSINSHGKVVGPLADHFGSDPIQFCVNACKHFDVIMRDICGRVATRTGQASYTVQTAKGNATVNARPAKSDPSAHVALLITLGALHHPAVLLEEGGRAQQGLPVKRGLDGGEHGFVWYPTVGMGGTRGFFGIDEAAAAAAALAIIVAVAPAIITGLIAVVGAIAPTVVKGVGDTVGGIFNPKPPPDPNAGKILGLDPPIAMAAGAVVLILLIVGAVAMKHHGHAAAA